MSSIALIAIVMLILLLILLMWIYQSGQQSIIQQSNQKPVKKAMPLSWVAASPFPFRERRSGAERRSTLTAYGQFGKQRERRLSQGRRREDQASWQSEH